MQQLEASRQSTLAELKQEKEHAASLFDMNAREKEVMFQCIHKVGAVLCVSRSSASRRSCSSTSRTWTIINLRAGLRECGQVRRKLYNWGKGLLQTHNNHY